MVLIYFQLKDFFSYLWPILRDIQPMEDMLGEGPENPFTVAV